jgi:helicase
MQPKYPDILNQIHPIVVKELERRQIGDLYPPQWDAIRAGLSGKNLIVSIPTASGKTMIAEILALNQLLRREKESRKTFKILYLAPLKALASEKYKEFTKAWLTHEIRIGLSVSDLDQHDFRVFSSDIIILTNEKANSLLQANPKLFQEIGMVICDEIHLINDDTRGITLEFLLTRIRTINAAVQIIGLSATIQNAHELANWLGAELITSDWRPVTLKEGYFSQNKINFADGSERTIMIAPQTEPIIAITIDMLKEGGQVLVFANSRKNAMGAAEKLEIPVRVQASEEDRKIWEKMASEFKKITNLEIETNKRLIHCIENGVAFHHAGLNNAELDFIVDHFNAKHIKVICATPTLAAGVNTPARRIIIQSLFRYTANKGNLPIPVMEYKQMAGRAGRPGYDPYGEVVIYGSDPKRVEELAEKFIFGEPERITSKLIEKKFFSFHVLGLIAGKYANTVTDLMQFLKNTFYFYQMSVNPSEDTKEQRSTKLKKDNVTAFESSKQNKGSKSKRNSGRGGDPLNIGNNDNTFTSADSLYQSEKTVVSPESPIDDTRASQILLQKLNECLEELEQQEFLTKTIDNDHSSFKATKFGQTTIQMYMIPDDAIILKEAMKYASVLLKSEEMILHPVSWLHQIAKTSQIPEFYLRKDDYSPLIDFISEHGDNFIEEEVPDPNDSDFAEFAVKVKSALILLKWIDEMPDRDIVENFDIGPGDLRRLIENAQWVMRAFVQFTTALKMDEFKEDISNLNQRVLHGIRSELLPLITLKGVGRVRARKIYHEGYRTLEDLKAATEEKLAQIPLIGKEIAKSIYEQLHQIAPTSPKRIRKKTSKQKISKSADVPETEELNEKAAEDVPKENSNHSPKGLDRFFR